MALPVKQLNEKFEGQFEFKRRNISVPFALPGDLVQFQIFRQGRKQKVKVLFIEKKDPPDPEIPVSKPFCEHFGTCGGCRGQHLDYSFQLKLKSDSIRKRFESITGVLPELIPARITQGHRNRMDFSIQGNQIGLRPAGDYSSIVDVKECPVLRPSGQQVYRVLRNAIQLLPANHEIKYGVIRSGSKSGCLILNARVIPESFVHELITHMPENYSLIHCLPADSDISVTSNGRILNGNSSFLDELGSIAFQVPYDSFFQPAPDLFQQLLDRAFDSLKQNTDFSQTENASLIDLFCGAGVLSRLVVESFPQFSDIAGYESVASSVELASRQFDGLNVLTQFYCVDLNQPESNLFDRNCDLLIADPPRPGLGPKLTKLIAERKPAETFLYISCNPKSMVDDLQTLKSSYKVIDSSIVDCYPQTPHLEQFALMKKL